MALLLKSFCSITPYRGAKHFKTPFNSLYTSRMLFHQTSNDGSPSDNISRRPMLDNILTENEYMHQILASNKLYVNSIAFLDYLCEKSGKDVNSILNKDSLDVPAYTLVNQLKIILENSDQNPDIMQNLTVSEICGRIGRALSELRDEHFWNLMKILCLWPNRERDQRFFDLCKNIDQDAVRRMPQWGYDSLLLTIDHFYRLRVVKYCEFVWYSMKRLWRNPGKLSPQQVVHAMFLVNTRRKWHPSVEMPHVESVLMNYIYDLSVEEVGILAMAFFKTHTAAANINLVEKMYYKLMNRVEDVNSITLCAYLKFFRLCTPHSLKHMMLELLSLLMDRIDDVSIPCCTHMALIGTDKLIYHPESIKKISEKFYKHIKDTRLKDMERLVYALQKFNFVPNPEEDIFKKVIEEIHLRESEVEEFPKVFLRSLHYLALKGYYDYELLNRGLSVTYLKSAFHQLSQYTIPPDVLHISMGAKLECPDYKGNLLCETLIDKLWQHHSLKLPQEGKNLFGVSLILLSIKNVTTMLFGAAELLHLVFVLPYFSRADVIFCLKDGKPVTLPQDLREKKYVNFGPPPNLGGTWYALVSLDKNVTIRDTFEPIGPLNSKLKHLKLLGYKPLLVVENIWTSVDIDKKEYLKNLIYGSS